ncbi:MAG: Transferase hexapeptide repeat containing protein [candidate division WS6 bacterium GW2011_GWC2_36_7]|uniref:Transferase hexapeptide repeat containing protein n=2 Tax=Bacteria candidate phyla TaxID=1783234 RepID=A0A0G0FD89_9BACT|nr:MAG: Transferase hexapeptide repeat containing protein [Candidatus Nomurabacteria bacterium GW2011_GWE1_35_16]KKQ11460.1 MAG: Transferase hexapeptide repeat containing protein [candidate division WS6 bacterium GW2011_GWC2_36_7]KKQ47588.1 MAG: Transferase hexapeptide repeat containing protein [Candidatus Moranbacteria bacterium GW2011_GWD2_37_9]
MIFTEDFNKKELITFEGNIRVHPDAQISAESVIGENTLILDSKLGKVTIGESCIIGNFTILEENVNIGDGSKIWHFCHIRNDVKIGKNCILGDYVFIDSGVQIGDETKIQNYVPVYHGVVLEEGVFLGPNSLTTNDLIPRARTEKGEIKGGDDWQVSAIHIGKDASIGAGAVLKPGINIGEKALIGAGAVVTKDVPAGAVVVGNPGHILRYIEGYEPK